MRGSFDVDKYLEQLERSESLLECGAVPLPDIKENQSFIFISYAHVDYKKVYRDLALMYDAGIRFWYDRGLRAGKNWDEDVKGEVLSPNCVGVIFFISEAFFVSKSANMEVELLCGEGGLRKNYFCVNLSDKQPNGIMKSAMLMDAEGFDMDRIGVLARAFSDKQTFLYYSEWEHSKKLVEQIHMQFDVMDLVIKSYALVDVMNNDVIPITSDSFMIGREKLKNHLVIEDGSVSRVHAAISENDGEKYIMDMGAGHGTFLNGERLQRLVPVVLHKEDVITFGLKKYRFVEQ